MKIFLPCAEKAALLHFRTSPHPEVITQQTVYHTAALPQAFHMLCHRQYSSLPGGRYQQIKDELTSKLYEKGSTSNTIVCCHTYT